MEGLVKGDVIVIDFPFSGLKISKRRPALVIKVPKGEDVIIAQITGESYENSVEILIKQQDFQSGKLSRDSYVRIDKIASVEKYLVKYVIGKLRLGKFDEILNKIVGYFRS